MEIEIETNPTQWDHKLLARLFGRSGWGREEDYQDETGHLLLEASDNIIVAVALSDDRSQLLGYIRAFTDHVSVTWIAELLVDPDFRMRGIGTRLMNKVVEKTRHTALYAGTFTGTEGFFEKFSLTPKPKLIIVSRKPLQSDAD